MVVTTLRALPFEEALGHVDRGAVFVDLRDVSSYLDVHIPGSLALEYEFGPGMAGRARDCMPLSVPLVLIESEAINMLHAAASLRGKGFNVLGQVGNALSLWSERRGQLASTELVEGPIPPPGKIIDVADPGRRRYEVAELIPIEKLWSRRNDLEDEKAVVVQCGRGVRAALSVGMLERVGVGVALWRRAD